MKQELLAPAGNIEAGYAALYYGADAVYLGLQKFSARAGADNFDPEALDAFTAYAHSLNRKVYAAINTVIQENELDELLQSLDLCMRCKIDAVILQDLGVAKIIREKYPTLELHASTQMAVHNKEGALFLQTRGFSRVVLARELTLSEIKEISAIEGLETEAFIHGALCYSYSGLCQFSSVETGRSANRGKCMYPCRACFKSKKGENHIFSMKDMALQQDVLKMPVTSLKIEGRKKSPLYVAAVTDYYRRILDGKGEDAGRAENIRQIFSRPWCKFHFNGKDKNIIDRNFVGHRGLFIGQIQRAENRRLYLKLGHGVGKHDGLQIDIPTYEKPCGFSVQNIKVNGRSVFFAQTGDLAEISLPPTMPPLKKGLNVYLASSSEVKGSYPYTKPKPNEFSNTTDIDVKIAVGANHVIATAGKQTAEIEGVFTPAEQPSQVIDSFSRSFAKTGGTKLSLRRLDINNPSGLFVPVSCMNELRRKLYEQIKPEFKNTKLSFKESRRGKSEAKWIIKTDNIDNLAQLDLEKFAEIIILLNENSSPKNFSRLPKNKIRLALPAVCRRTHVYVDMINKMLEAQYNKWEVSNYWALEVLPLEKLDISFDAPLYMFNSQAVSEASQIGARRITLPIEDTLENMRNVLCHTDLDTVVVVYQDSPLFTSAACIRDNPCSECDRGEKWIELEKDGQQYQALSRDCQIMLFNKKPLCINEETQKLNVNYKRMDFCYKQYSAENVRKIADELFSGRNVKNGICANINSAKI